MRIRKRYVFLIAVVLLLILILVPKGPRPGHVLDEAKRAGVTAETLNPIAQVDMTRDYFHEMDPGVTLQNRNEINGRNMWILWTGGNDRFWDTSATLSLGNVDLLKTVSSYIPEKDPTLDDAKREALKKVYKSRRANRWDYLGAINEPCFFEADGPDPKRYGLWLDKRDPNCPPDPFENPAAYPGVRIGARGKNIPVGSYYGYASGIVGLRLFPNPDFDEAAAKRWDPVRFYTDPSYYRSKDLVRPYRVGVSCGFCHVGPDPVRPPTDPENPAWRNLNSIVGGQYLWVDRVFSWESRSDNFVTQIFRTWRPGTVDPSFVSQDNIENPRTINAVYNVDARLQLARRFGREKLSRSNLENRQLNTYVPATDPLASFFKPPDTVYAMHVLKDGSDSIGVVASLDRVYLNIGLFSEEWLLHFTPMTGGSRTTPIDVDTVRRNSVYWQATENQTYDMAAFLIRAGKPHKLSDVATSELPSGISLKTPVATLELGKRAFADRCLRCHSSKLPEPPATANPGNCPGSYLNCWNRYWTWTQSDEFRAEARKLVAEPDFLDGNFLSTDIRVPVTLLQTNLCSSLATNAIRNNIWDNFSSETYKNLPSVGRAVYYHPFTGEKKTYDMPAGGRGYIRPASLVSLWSTAPYLLNNSVGPFDPSPSVAARLKSFQVSITQMLWPQTRDKDPVLGSKIPGVIDRTTSPSYLAISAGYLPHAVRPLLGFFATLMPGIFNADERRGVLIGPFPTGTPVELIANLQLALDEGGAMDQVKLDGRIIPAMRRLIVALEKARGKSDDEARRIVFAPEVVEPLLSLSKCPDYIVNRGHYFGAEGVEGEAPLGNDERAALIQFLRTF
jgi:hypothetical protein